MTIEWVHVLSDAAKKIVDAFGLPFSRVDPVETYLTDRYEARMDYLRCAKEYAKAARTVAVIKRIKASRRKMVNRNT